MSSLKKMIMMGSQNKRSVFWNQFIKSFKTDSLSAYGMQRIYDSSTGYVTISGSPNKDDVYVYNNGTDCMDIPKETDTLLFTVELINPDSTNCKSLWLGFGNSFVIPLTDKTIYQKIFIDNSGYSYPFERYRKGMEFNNTTFRAFGYNLTLMFGAGNEPTTVEEFYQRIEGIPVDIYAYNPGEIIEW